MRILLTTFAAATALVHAESATSFVVPVGELVATGGSPAVIRPIVGIRGSQVMGSPLSRGRAVQAAPGGGFAIVEVAGKLYVAQNAGGAEPVLLRTAADAVTFSSGGSAVALLDRESATVEVWTGLPGAPRLHATVSAAGMSTVEVSDDGEVCLGVSEPGDVFVLSPGSAPRRSALSGTVRRIRFVPGSSEVLVLDRDGMVLRGSAGTGDLRVVGGLDGSFADVALGRDGDVAVLAGADSLVYLPLRGGEPVKVKWSRGVPRVGSLRGGQFAVTVAGEPGVWVLSADATLSYIAEI